jgi:hypothetical protein
MVSSLSIFVAINSVYYIIYFLASGAVGYLTDLLCIRLFS